MGRNDRVHVFLRVRPNRDRRGPDDEGYLINHSFDKSTIQFHVDKRGREDEINHSVEDYRFEFDRVFGPKTTQEELFNMVAKDCVLSAMDGYNSTIFAYGQTGSGKTFSITGGTESYADRGIIPRTLSLVFDECAKRTEQQWTIRISYLQIYNDKGQDLLNRGKDAKTLDELPQVSVHETEEEIVLKGLEAHPSNNIHEALNLLFLGDTNRLYCETPMNKTSSRSHCIFTINIEGRSHGSATVRRSKLNLVDLAGSERVGKTGVVGNLLTEAKYINLSLHYLEHVIVALSEQSKGQREHVPYRNSFMTMCLRDSLGGNCRTAMLATAHPAPEYFMETISTCKFAQRVACIKQDARVNEETDPAILVRKLKGQIAQLNEQLAFYKKGDQSTDRVMDADEYERCREVVQRFLDDPDPNANISGINGDLVRILACFRIMRGMLGGKAMVVPGATVGGGAPASSASAAASAAAPSSSSAAESAGASSEEIARMKSHVEALTVSLQQKENEISLLFNIVEKSSAPKFNAETQTGDPSANNSGGYGGGGDVYGRAGTSARRESAPQPENPASLAGLLQQRNQQQQQQQQGQEADSTSSSSAAPLLSAVELNAQDERMKENYDLSALADAELLKDRQAAFEAFRRSYRKYEQIEKNKADLKTKYDECKAIAFEVNSCVDAIKQLKLRVNQLRADRALQGVAEPYSDEAAAMEQLSAAKEMYQSKGAELGKKKEYIDHMHLVMMRAQEQLAKDFDDWFTTRLKQLHIAQHQQQRLKGGGGGGAGGQQQPQQGGGAAAGSGSRAVLMQQMEFGGNMVPAHSYSSSSSSRAPPAPALSLASSVPPLSSTASSSVGGSAALGSTYGGGGGGGYGHYGRQPSSSSGVTATPYSTASSSSAAAPNLPSSAPMAVGRGGEAATTGASLRQRSPPPSTTTTTSNPYLLSSGGGGFSAGSSGFNSSTPAAGGGGGGGDRSSALSLVTSSNAYARYNSNNNNNNNAFGSPASILSTGSGSSAFVEAQHTAAMAQHAQHAQQMQTITNTSANSLYAGPSAYYASPLTASSSSSAPSYHNNNNNTGGPLSAGYGPSSSAAFGRSSSQPPLGSSTSASTAAAGGMNPYCPAYPSTGDDAADQQLAAMYKARDEMRARLQAQQRR